LEPVTTILGGILNQDGQYYLVGSRKHD
jgi:hypothetical protein